MPTSGAIEAGRAVLRIVAVDSGVRGALNEIESALEQTATRARNIGLAITATGLAGLGTLTAAISEAGRAEEIASKFAEVFGAATDQMQTFFRVLADEVNRSEVDLQEFGAGFQDLLQPIGFDTESAREYSGVLTKLAIDLASFNNRRDSDAVRDLQAALTGSSETVKRYGVIVNEAAVKQELLSQGIKDSEATDVDKVYARIAIILRQTTAAQGDATRTASSFTNQLKGLASAVRDTAIAIGNALLPIVTPVVSVLRFLTQQVRNVAEAFPFLTGLLAGGLVVFTALGAAIATAAVAAGLLLSPYTLLTIALGFLGISQTQALFATARLIAGFITLSGAARAAGAAVSLLTGAVRLFLVSPIGIAIAAVAIALPLAAGGFAVAGSAARDAASDINAFVQSIEDVRQAEQALEVLRGYAEQSSLTSEQQRRAAGLIDALNARYGDLGLRVDESTGKLIALDNAFADFAARLSGDLLKATENDLKETTGLIEDLQAAIQEVQTSNAPEDSRSKVIAKFTEELEKARLRADELRDALAALDNADAKPRELTSEEIEERDQFNQQQRRRLIDARIALIEDERKRRIVAAEEAARRDFQAAEKANGDKRIIAARLAAEIEQINRDANTRLAEQQQREAERAASATAGFAADRREAEIRLALEGRELELALLKEQEREKIEQARRAGLATLDIEREFAARRAQVNKQFDAQDQRQAERAVQRQRAILIQAARGLQIQGTLATRVAGQQFARGGDNVAEDQLSELQRINQSLRRMERRQGGIVAF